MGKLFFINKVEKSFIKLLVVNFLVIILSAQCFAENVDTLAVVGNKVISLHDFQTSYKEKITKTGLTDNGETRYKYLMNLVNDEVLIQYAKQSGFDKTEKAQAELKRIYTQELLNSFTDKYITPTINVTEDDLIKLFIDMNTRIKVSHIYADKKEKADSLYDELINGAEFEKLAEENFDDPVLRNNHGSLGYITVDEMDPAFERTAYAMKVGEISMPVKTTRGYSIIRVEDIKQNPLYTESEYLKAHKRLKTFARKRAFEELVTNFANNLHNRLAVKFNESFISKLYRSLQQIPIDELIETNSIISGNDLNEIVVTSELGKWNLQTLINKMSVSTEKQSKWIRTKENLKEFISGLINREFILQSAEKEKLDTLQSFKKNVDFNFGSYLLTEVENNLREQISISPDSLKSYYKNNLAQFKAERQIRLSSILLESKTLMDSVKILLERGEQFENLAEQFSTQELTAQVGGDLGYYKINDLDYLGEKVFALNVGEWIGPVSEAGKYVFLKCTGFKEPITKSFEEAKPEIENTLTSFRFFELREQFAESLKNKIHLEVFLEKLNTLNLLTRVE